MENKTDKTPERIAFELVRRFIGQTNASLTFSQVESLREEIANAIRNDKRGRILSL